MKYYTRLTGLLLAAMLATSFFPAAHAAELPPLPLGPMLLAENEPPAADEDTVFTEEALVDWFVAHKDTGGRVTLGADMTITQSEYLLVEEPAVIDTGAFSLIFDGGHLLLEGAEIIGAGVDDAGNPKPVVDVYDVGGSWSGPFHWINAVQPLHVTATGRDGTGGTAVRVSCNGSASLKWDAMKEEGAIRAYGAGAVGLYLTEAQEAFCLNISVEGENSTAVYAEKDLTLYYCKLAAAGDGATALDGTGTLLLDTCAASPVSDAVAQEFYRIAGTLGRSFYLPLQQNSEDAAYTYDSYTFLLQNEDGSATRRESFYVDWSEEPDYLSRDTLGQQELAGQLFPLFAGLGLADDFDLTLLVDVRDPAIPCIADLKLNTAAEPPYAIFDFWQSYDPAVDAITLWRSNDGGETWCDFTDSKTLEWEGEYLLFYYDEITAPITFQLELAGVGESNLATLYPQEGGLYGGLGGDRVGTDRVTQGGTGTPGIGQPQNPGDDDPEKPNPPRDKDKGPGSGFFPPKTPEEAPPAEEENSTPVLPPQDENPTPPTTPESPPGGDAESPPDGDAESPPDSATPPQTETPSATLPPPAGTAPTVPAAAAPTVPAGAAAGVPTRPAATDAAPASPPPPVDEGPTAAVHTPHVAAVTNGNAAAPSETAGASRSSLRTILLLCGGGALGLLALSFYWKRRA